ncbi:peptide chain release factor N(5)-glutamine methyltransferase [Pontixanthobacter gangjinensis]|uniref:Release factor glutamine methyltransferase n=1 Tax=Pontixanthobacter gangjinensis TaxID=1028742 RepID=A0A6I4SJ70_9SPHN|nr:peptide chain release factor N(5)-glutamine methyltransferase [Pontixanthobacter gangjinensis]MXO55458.1 peptide chain release factor N(5)-glutamine methyltransferase [Pontixanthobacter gangjinensis]
MNSVAATLREAANQLGDISDTARLDAELLMAHALGISRSQMLLSGSGLEVPRQFADLLQRRTNYEPVAYILGHQEFFGREFLVTPDVLIPRPDSETIIETALANCQPDARILDLGTGSGVLLLTLLAELPQSTGIGIDESLAAVSVAAANAAKLGVADRAHLIHADWTEDGWADALGRFDLIVANPPYVETTVALEKSVADYEPAKALYAGPDGLDDYRILVPQLRNLLTQQGVAVLEIGYQQDVSVARIAQQSGFQTELHRDLAHRPRALLLR